MGQLLTTTHFYFYGRRHFTKSGYEQAIKTYRDPQALEKAVVEGKVFMVTGANSGIGYAISLILASKGGEVFMVCRNKERGEEARQKILNTIKYKDNVHLIIGDCGLRKDVVRIVDEFNSQRPKLDVLVCNAGALTNTKQLTAEGVESTFATHLLFGTYLLAKLLMPTLQKSPTPKVIAVSSGGMYNVHFPNWDVATSQTGKYDGQLAYAYAKRGQVLLCERWAKQHPEIKFVSCHPGWVDTPGVEAAYGSSKRWLEPLRNLDEGAEGIVWLCVAPSADIENGEFYLDRLPQKKHLSENTKNTPIQVDQMMSKLEEWSISVPEQKATKL